MRARPRARALLPLVLLLGACAPAPPAAPPSRAATALPGLPEMKTFPAPQPAPPQRANGEIYRDFLDLTFQLESGRRLSRFSRFEEPISIRVTGDAPPTLLPDLTRLLTRLRREAGIDIAQAREEPASITIEAVSQSDIRRYLTGAACFVVPNVSSLREYHTARHSRRTSWGDLTRRSRIAVFVPADGAPQEVRDCMHEELAQALGPLNDLYRLPDSVFNDDNVHAVLTGFDMLILRAYYAPELRSGMTREQVAARLPAILSRLNPGGDRISPRPVTPTPRRWIDAIQTALGPGAGFDRRRRAGKEALAIAQRQGWNDHRLGFSHFALGQMTQTSDPEAALRQFLAADKVYRQALGTGLHCAYSASQVAAYAIGLGQGEQALRIIGPHLATAKRHENAALLATLLMLRAEALDLTGHAAEARAARLDSLGWARYGFGIDWAMDGRLHDISTLSSPKEPDG